ncbi:MAG: hypothetical protein E7321_10435 [Clostridiales bacterium]|nr:hypothetical protein [Clostridiales bacterium]
MISPFDRKNAFASALDHLALRALILTLCVAYFSFLWESGASSMIAGLSLFALICLSIMLFEKRTLSVRDRLLRERIGGMIALDELIMLPSGEANRRICALLRSTLDADELDETTMRYGGETWLIRLSQCLPGTTASQGDVLGAHRARMECGADKVALVCTASFSPEATRAAEWADPPVRLIGGRQLALLFGRMHPATDEDITRHLARQKKPFTWQRIKALALAPSKLRRYLLCAFLLLMLYFVTRSLSSLLACLLSFWLAILCGRENRRRFTL